MLLVVTSKTLSDCFQHLLSPPEQVCVQKKQYFGVFRKGKTEMHPPPFKFDKSLQTRLLASKLTAHVDPDTSPLLAILILASCSFKPSFWPFHPLASPLITRARKRTGYAPWELLMINSEARTRCPSGIPPKGEV